MPIKHVLTKEEGNYSSEYYLQIISSRKMYYIFYTDTDSSSCYFMLSGL